MSFEKNNWWCCLLWYFGLFCCCVMTRVSLFWLVVHVVLLVLLQFQEFALYFIFKFATINYLYLLWHPNFFVKTLPLFLESNSNDIITRGRQYFSFPEILKILRGVALITFDTLISFYPKSKRNHGGKQYIWYFCYYTNWIKLDICG